MPELTKPERIETPADCEAQAAYEWDSKEVNHKGFKDRDTYIATRAGALRARLRPEPVKAEKHAKTAKEK